MDQQRKTVITLIAVLGAVITVSVIVVMMLPSKDAPIDLSPDISNDTLKASAPSFNLKVLDRTGYKSLNQEVIQNGSLPVVPPPATGKANPFL